MPGGSDEATVRHGSHTAGSCYHLAEGGPPPPGTIPDTIPATNEQEPNNFLDTAQVVDVSSNTVRIVGSVETNDDTDLFSLGSSRRGDRVTVTLDGAATDAQVSVALIDVQSDWPRPRWRSRRSPAGTGFSGAVLDALIRKDGTYHVGIVRRFGNIEPTRLRFSPCRCSTVSPFPVPSPRW